MDAPEDDEYSDPIGRQPDALIDELHHARRQRQHTLALAQATLDAIDTARRAMLLARDAAVRTARS